MRRWGTGAAVLVVLLAGCTTGQPDEPAARPEPSPSVSATSSAAPSPSPSPSPASPSDGATGPAPRKGPRLDTWEMGAHILPLAPDGFGGGARPAQLGRRADADDREPPPPPTDRYVASVGRITPWVRDRMGTSWARGCPVALRQLSYVRVTFRGFDHRPHTGELIVRKGHARGIVQVFRTLYRARFPIEQMTLPTSAERDLTPSGDGNGTGADRSADPPRGRRSGPRTRSGWPST